MRGVDSFSGSLHLWTGQSAAALPSSSSSLLYAPAVCASGHSQSVVDCCWDDAGRYLLSASADQTSRVYAPIRALAPTPSDTSSSAPWCEIARPQSHGFDLTSACLLSGPVEHRMCSGADEKVVRVFLATHSFVQTLRNVSTQPSTTHSDKSATSPSLELSEPFAASVPRSVRAVLPELGLSNRGLHAGDEMQQLKGFTPHTATVQQQQLDDDDEEEGNTVSTANRMPASALSARVAVSLSSVFSLPPSDSQLAQLTLWPEVDKLYGHGNEIRRLSASPDGRLLASSCAAKTAAQAHVLLFDTQSWSCVGTLHGHLNTVSCIAFSHDSAMLLTGSKDRHVALTRITRTQPHSAALSFDSVRLAGHTRIVWGCAWSPDDAVFATCSRDKTVRLWSYSTQPLSATTHSNLLTAFPTAVTAVAFAPTYTSSSSAARCYQLAVGSDTGDIFVWKIDGARQESDLNWLPTAASCVLRVDAKSLPAGTINSLMFRPPRRTTSDDPTATVAAQEHTLSVASADHTLRVYRWHA